ncbi:hypothetical protein QE152_g25844 [Popillia japonica]|uniref:KxDL domain-containing protein n=1 Tax=Popillia japonica TaxID=7064 RepID=A0AAW1K0A7_POPJA
MEDTKDTPETESEFSIECFQNYTAPEVFIQGLAGIVAQQDVETMIRAQKQMLQRFEKTNEMLTNCNALSANRLKTVGPEFKKHTQLLVDMKKDLDYIFKKIRAIKTKLSSQYSDAFAEALRSSLAEECKEDEDLNENNTKEEAANPNNNSSVNCNTKRNNSISSDSDTQIDSNIN